MRVIPLLFVVLLFGCAQIVCTQDAKVCPDGSAVGRTGPNCEFAECPPMICPTDTNVCPDGSMVSRVGTNCEFAPCPLTPAGCTKELKTCPDGSTVSRVAPSCAFAVCPAPNTTQCDYSNPDHTYLKRGSQCVINFMCVSNKQAFRDGCGCGCQTIS